MPLITTHNYFANDVFSKTNTKITDTFKEKKNIYELFAQGTDPFIFYEAFRLKKVDYQHICHTKNTDTFFLKFIGKIKEKNLTQNPTVLASLYGHLTHYVLDSSVHPYIVYKTGFYNKKRPETLKYNGLHNKMEMEIDAYLYEKKSKKPFKDFKIHKHLITKEKLDKELINLLNELYNDIYSFKNGGDKYQKGCRIMYNSYKFFIKDQTGIKKQVYKIIDKMTPKKVGVFENYNSHITKIDLSIFNLEHKTCVNPWDNTIKNNASFFDLYNKALEECLELFESTHQFLHNQINEEKYKAVLKDKSYLTGLSWKLNKEMKYLEF